MICLHKESVDIDAECESVLIISKKAIAEMVNNYKTVPAWCGLLKSDRDECLHSSRLTVNLLINFSRYLLHAGFRRSTRYP